MLLLPIAAPSGSYSWVGRAIQQDVEVDLTQMGIARVIAPASGSVVDDTPAALKAARDAGATHVVYAQAQISGNQMRVIGQVLDVNDGKQLAAIKMTAPADNLFPLEDGLSVQIARALPGGPEALASAAAAQNQQQQQRPTVVYGQPSDTNTVTQQPAPQYYSTTPDYTPYTTNNYVYTYPYDDSYGYGYPYYGYGYYPFGLYYGGFGFYGGHYYNHFRGSGFRGGFGGGFHGGGFHGGGHVGGGHR